MLLLIIEAGIRLMQKILLAILTLFLSVPAALASAQDLAVQNNNPYNVYSRSSTGFFSDGYNPFEEMINFQKRMNSMFKDINKGMANQLSNQFNQPKIDIQESDEAYVYKIDLSNYESDKVKVQIENGVFILSAERKTSNESSNSSGFYSSQQSFGMFRKAFELPGDADADSLTVQDKEGTLFITIPKVSN